MQYMLNKKVPNTNTRCKQIQLYHPVCKDVNVTSCLRNKVMNLDRFDLK